MKQASASQSFLPLSRVLKRTAYLQTLSEEGNDMFALVSYSTQNANIPFCKEVGPGGSRGESQQCRMTQEATPLIPGCPILPHLGFKVPGKHKNQIETVLGHC